MKLKPLHDYVIVKPLIEDMTESRIVLPDTVSQNKPEQGEVLAVGPGKILESGELAKVSLKIGDKILFKKYSADEITIDEDGILVIQESDIIAIIN